MSKIEKQLMAQYNAKAKEYFATSAYLRKYWVNEILNPSSFDRSPDKYYKVVTSAQSLGDEYILKYKDLDGFEQYNVKIYKNGKVDKIENMGADVYGETDKIACILSKDKKGVYYCEIVNNNINLFKNGVVKYHEFGTSVEADYTIAAFEEVNFYLINSNNALRVGNYIISNEGRIYDISRFITAYINKTKIYKENDNTLKILERMHENASHTKAQCSYTIKLTTLELVESKRAILSSEKIIEFAANESGTYDMKIGNSVKHLDYKNFGIIAADLHNSGKIILKCAVDAKETMLIFNTHTQELDLTITAETNSFHFNYEGDFDDDTFLISYHAPYMKAGVSYNGERFVVQAESSEYDGMEVKSKDFVVLDDNQDPRYKTLMINTRDNMKVPVSLVYDEALVKFDGSNPLYLLSYSAYGINSDIINYKPIIEQLVDKGFICALVEARGSSALGKEWHLAGRGVNKENTLNDLMDAIDYFIANKYTSVGNIALSGGSAGGFNVASLINKHPEYFKAAILHAPYVNINPENEEFVDPDNVANDFARKNPISNIKPASYPAVYVRAGANDVRTPSQDAMEYVMKLEASNQSKVPIIFEVIENMGHSPNTYYHYYDGIFKELSFIEAQFGLGPNTGE